MGDTGDDFRAWKEDGQKRRENNREYSPKILEKEGIKFDVKNWGAHLVVHGNNETIDFWPGTGKWIVRGGKTARGVFPLIKYIKRNKIDWELMKKTRATPKKYKEEILCDFTPSSKPPWED